ncbi:hypothetical protein VM1G_10066 [Cytospora mali]|uniref:Uncharacterized protein n=1 Tax=Cytospora mali TaxID=578113 RepID=A0A194WEE7_CYTMA|nr:hypothetical protein VM1G_10066 [Valsa mali]
MDHRDPRDPRNPFYSRYPDDPDDPRNKDIPSDYFFPVPDRVEYFDGHPERQWPAWKFDMGLMELFDSFVKEFNTMTIPMLDIEAFNNDVYEIATIAQDKQELYRLLAERRDLRQQELLRMWRRALDHIMIAPSLIKKYDRVEQWGNIMYICHWKSFDSYIRYFTGFLPDEEPPVAALHNAAPTEGKDRRAESPLPLNPPAGVREATSGVKRPAPDACEDDQQEGPPHVSKKARTDSRPTEPIHSPEITEHQDRDVMDYWQDLARQARSQAEAYVYRAQREHANYCRSRLQIPAVSDGASMAARSDAGESSRFPHPSSLEDDDPVVAVFGSECAARWRAHRSDTRLQSSPAFSWLFPDYVPEVHSESDNLVGKDQVGAKENGGVATANAVKESPNDLHNQETRRPRRQRAHLRQRGSPRDKVAPKKEQPPKVQGSRRSTRAARAARAGTSPTTSTTSHPRRLTRQSGGNKALYELDGRSSARMI